MKGPAMEAAAPRADGPGISLQKRTAHLWVGVAEHHVAAAERVAANVAEARSAEGLCAAPRGRVRKALTGKASALEKGKK